MARDDRETDGTSSTGSISPQTVPPSSIPLQAVSPSSILPQAVLPTDHKIPYSPINDVVIDGFDGRSPVTELPGQQQGQIALGPRAPVPIPPQQSTDQRSTSLASLGPMSTTVVIPERPKPGRKPIQHEDAADRRRMQNRLAQRNFRDKRQQKLAEVTRSLQQNEERHLAEIGEKERELDRWRHRAANAERQLRDEVDFRRRIEKELVRLRNIDQLANGYAYLFRDSQGAAVDSRGHGFPTQMAPSTNRESGSIC